MSFICAICWGLERLSGNISRAALIEQNERKSFCTQWQSTQGLSNVTN